MHYGATEPFSPVGTSCPTCGAAAEEGQLVCLECGSRIALDYRRPPRPWVPVAIVAGVVLLVAVAGAAAFEAIDDEAKREVARTPVKVEGNGRGAEAGKRAAADKPASRKPAAKKPARQAAPAKPKRKPKEKERRPPKRRAQAPAPAGLVPQGELYRWPGSLRAFTVVLISTEDRTSATNFARSAAKGRPAKIGVIRSDDFESLPKGFYLVFAGRYANRAQADKAAARLGGRFKGAFPQLVAR